MYLIKKYYICLISDNQKLKRTGNILFLSGYLKRKIMQTSGSVYIYQLHV